MQSLNISGFTGTNCEINIDDCEGNVCQVMIMMIMIMMIMMMCQNGGTCVDGINTYTCQCPVNWTGRYCLENVDECALLDPCQVMIMMIMIMMIMMMCQNHGTCRDTEGGYECICVNGFQVRPCQASSTLETQQYV